MRRMEMKICKKCGAPYIWWIGGINPSYKDYSDMGMCEKCRCKSKVNIVKKVLEIFDK